MTIKYQIPNYAKLQAEGYPRTPSETAVLDPRKGIEPLGYAYIIDREAA